MPKVISENLRKTGYRVEEDLYRQAATSVIASQSGLERYILDMFGPGLIGSFACALDPFRQFRNVPKNVSLLSDGAPIVRTRTPRSIQESPRKETWKEFTLSRGYARNPQAGLFDYYYFGPDRVNETTSTTNRGSQVAINGLIRDTTRRTRPLGFSGGEFELFIPRTTTAARSHTFMRQLGLVYNSIGTGQLASTEDFTNSSVTGPELRFTNATVQALLAGIRSRALSKIQENVAAMFEHVQPRHKTYDLFYQIAELRDLPRTWRGTIEVWRDFEQLIGRDLFSRLVSGQRRLWSPELHDLFTTHLGNRLGYRYDRGLSPEQIVAQSYLNFKFGWESTFRGLVDFLPSPAQVSREVNFLIDSIGKDQTFRSKKKWIENEASFPTSSNPQPMRREQLEDGTLRYSGFRKCELRLTANFTLNFPPLEVPKLRRELFLRRMGIVPSPSDIYNLVPWTWLADWFGGAGDYVKLLDTISNDRSLVNHSFITYREESETTVGWTGKYVSTESRTINGVNAQSQKTELYRHSQKFSYVYQLRRSVPSVSAIKSYWDPNLGPSQLAILGALFSSKRGSVGVQDAS